MSYHLILFPHYFFLGISLTKKPIGKNILGSQYIGKLFFPQPILFAEHECSDTFQSVKLKFPNVHYIEMFRRNLYDNNLTQE